MTKDIEALRALVAAHEKARAEGINLLEAVHRQEVFNHTAAQSIPALTALLDRVEKLEEVAAFFSDQLGMMEHLQDADGIVAAQKLVGFKPYWEKRTKDHLETWARALSTLEGK